MLCSENKNSSQALEPGTSKACTDTVFQQLHDACSGGYYVCMVAGIPCSKRSVNLIGDDGGEVLYTRLFPDGVPWASPVGRAAIDVLNLLTARTVELALVVLAFIIKNPVDRGGTKQTNRYFRDEWRNHGPLWLSTPMRRLRKLTGAGEVSFPQCALGQANGAKGQPPHTVRHPAWHH